jgi:hypothetical protein
MRLNINIVDSWRCTKCQTSNPSELVICQECRHHFPGCVGPTIEKTPHGNLSINLSRTNGAKINLGISLLFWGLLALVMVLFFNGLSKRANDARQARLDCETRSTEKTSINGTIRQAGSDFFLQKGNTWRKITHACTGKNGHSCLINNPGIAALKENIGKEVVIETCESEVVRYTVEGKRYLR